MATLVGIFESVEAAERARVALIESGVRAER